MRVHGQQLYVHARPCFMDKHWPGRRVQEEEGVTVSQRYAVQLLTLDCLLAAGRQDCPQTVNGQANAQPPSCQPEQNQTAARQPTACHAANDQLGTLQGRGSICNA